MKRRKIWTDYTCYCCYETTRSKSLPSNMTIVIHRGDKVLACDKCYGKYCWEGLVHNQECQDRMNGESRNVRVLREYGF